jgi:hypothetical protein
MNPFKIFSEFIYILTYINFVLDRFPEVAFLHFVFWFEIRGKINKLALSKNTRYAAYLVFKMSCSVGFKNTPVELSVGVEGCLQNTKKAYLHPDVEYKMYCRELRRGHNNVRSFHNRLVGLSFPSGRSDGWLEIEMGEFFNSGLENEEIHMSVMEINCGNIKRRFFLEGIEVRPKLNCGNINCGNIHLTMHGSFVSNYRISLKI